MWIDILMECVWMLGIEQLVCPHHSDKVFCLRQIDDVMRVTRQHVHGLYVVTADLKLYNIIGSNLALLY